MRMLIMNKIRGVLFIIITFQLGLGFYLSPNSYAQINCNSPEKVEDSLYSGAPFYDPCEEYNRFGNYDLNELLKDLNTTIGPVGEGTYQNINYNPPAGVALDSPTISLIQKYIDTYKQAEAETMIPWQLLVAIHFRENSLSLTNSSNCQGLFGFYTEANCERFPSGETVDQNGLKEQLVFLGNLIQSNYTAGGVKMTGQTTDLETIKAILFRYNGQASAYKPHNLAIIKQNCPGDNSYDNMPEYEFSSYVMSQYDACRMKMELDTRDAPGYQWGRDPRPGAITFMLLVSKQFGTPIIAGGGATLTGDVAQLASQGAQALAGQILNNSNISLNDRPRCNITQASKYGEYRGNSSTSNRTCDDAGSTRVPASPGTLAILLILAQKYQFTVTSIATGGHAQTSYHFSGRAIDIGLVNGVQVNSSSINNGIIQQFYRDLLNLLPARAEIGQQQCGIVSPNEYSSRGVDAVGDPCNHIHFGNV